MKELKFSNYNIIVRLKNDDKYFAVHGYTGASDLFEENIGKMLLEKDTKILEEARETIDYLIKRGYLCFEGTDEKQKIKNVADIMHRAAMKEYSLSILPTYDCNFRCPYCYEKRNISNKEKREIVISKQMVDSIFKAIDNSGAKFNKNICLYGGEPFIKENYEIIKYIVEKGYTKGFRFFAASNGYDLDFFQDIIDTDKINYLQITLDGLSDYHDNSRYLVGRKPTFNKIVQNIDWFIKKDINISIRTNVSKDSISQIEKLIGFYKGKNWTSYNNFRYYFSPINNCNESECGNRHNHINIFESIKLLKDDGIVPTEIVGIYSGITTRLKKYINNNKLVLFHSEACSSNKNGFLIDPSGVIYSCCDLVGSEFSCGKIENNNFIFNEQFEKWNSRYISEMNNCISCPYALFCGGGCTVQNIRSGKDINSEVCGGYKKIFDECLSNINII